MVWRSLIADFVGESLIGTDEHSSARSSYRSAATGSPNLASVRRPLGAKQGKVALHASWPIILHWIWMDCTEFQWIRGGHMACPHTIIAIRAPTCETAIHSRSAVTIRVNNGQTVSGLLLAQTADVCCRHPEARPERHMSGQAGQ
jgi:hypothetical protein